MDEHSPLDPTALTTQALLREIQNLKELLEDRIASVEKSIKVAHDDLVRVPTDVQKQVGNLRELHEEKFKTITQHVGLETKRYEQRFQAQEKAVEIALRGQEKAVEVALAGVNKEFHEHLIQVREETKTAFIVSERAISKAEAANEKRFESVNEFRAQLNEQAATFMTRVESLGRHESTAEKIHALTTRMDRDEGRGTGLNQGWVYLLGAFGLISTLIGITGAIIGVVMFANR